MTLYLIFRFFRIFYFILIFLKINEIFCEVMFYLLNLGIP